MSVTTVNQTSLAEKVCMHDINRLCVYVCVDIVHLTLFACRCLRAQWAFLLHFCMHGKHHMHMDQHTCTRTAIAL